MDDFNVSSLHESKNEWGSRLLTILTPLIMEGLKSIFDEAIQLCKTNNEMDKYLMTFQNFISRIPKWNPTIIDKEKIRIVERSGCGYLEDLVTCVHIIQLKLLTAIRVGQKQKKINITIPKIEDFIHRVYINVARKIYRNVYLYEINIPPLQIQKHQRELEIIIQECVLNTVRESIPVESILRAYMDETVEDDVVEEVKEEVIEKPHVINDKPEVISEIAVPEEVENREAENTTHTLESDFVVNNSVAVPEFDFPDLTADTTNLYSDNTEQSYANSLDNVNEYNTTYEDTDNVRLKIQDQSATLDNLDVHVLDEPMLNLTDDFLLDDIEILA